MKVSSKTQYAILAMIHLAIRYDAGRTVTAGTIARSQDIPLKFLTQIMLVLQKAGLVTAIRGKAGGYLLGRIPSKITLGDIVRAVEGPVMTFSPVSKSQTALLLSGVWREVGEHFEKRLDALDLYTIAEKAQGLSSPMFYI
jgi:Rrf2 family protein